MDAVANDWPDAHADAEITGDGAPVRAFVIPAREEVEIARGIREALAGS
jgi:acetate kinase